MNDEELCQIKKDFQSKLGMYEKLSYEAEKLIKDKLKAENFKTAYVLSRVKDSDSFSEKIHRKGYDKPFEQMSDIFGIRIVCLYTEDIKPISKLIANIFTIIREEDKAITLESDKIGYRDLHIDVMPKTGEKTRFEIQLRTVMSDAHSIIDHDLNYKKTPELPKELKRELNLVNAIMELSQIHCDALRARRVEFKEKVEGEARDATNQESFLNQPIIDDTLRVYTKKLFPTLPIKEHIHALILRDLNPDRYKTLRDIDNAMKFSKEFVKYYKTVSDSFKAGSDYITKSLGYYDEEFMTRHPFAQRTRDAIKEFKKSKESGV